MGKIFTTVMQRWVTTATSNGLSPTSVGKYHAMLNSIFERALQDRVVTFDPCAHTELPKKVKKMTRTLTPEGYAAILAALPAQHRLWRDVPSEPATPSPKRSGWSPSGRASTNIVRSHFELNP